MMRKNESIARLKGSDNSGSKVSFGTPSSSKKMFIKTNLKKSMTNIQSILKRPPDLKRILSLKNKTNVKFSKGEEQKDGTPKSKVTNPF